MNEKDKFPEIDSEREKIKITEYHAIIIITSPLDCSRFASDLKAFDHWIALASPSAEGQLNLFCNSLSISKYRFIGIFS